MSETETETAPKGYDDRTSVEITLDFPIKVDGETINSLTMRRGKIGDTVWQRKQSGDDFERGMKMMARLCNVTPEHIHELDEVDAMKVQAQYDSFRPKDAS